MEKAKAFAECDYIYVIALYFFCTGIKKSPPRGRDRLTKAPVVHQQKPVSASFQSQHVLSVFRILFKKIVRRQAPAREEMFMIAKTTNIDVIIHHITAAVKRNGDKS